MILSIGQGLLMSILGLGIFMTYRILNFPDMTAEGSFPLGGAVSVTAITMGIHPVPATVLGILAGMLAGLATGLLYTKGKVPVILSGILVMSALQSVMLFVMKRSNLSLLNHRRLSDFLSGSGLPKNYDTILIGLIAVALIVLFLFFFFHTQLGQGYIATGDNESMAKSLGIKTDNMKLLGLSISNGIIALSGSLMAQYEGSADMSKGIGVIVIGLASIIIGEVVFGELRLGERLVAIVVGSIFYQLLILGVIKLGVDTNYLKIFSSAILALFLILPQISTRKFVKKGRG
ncbi:ABC transporter permease [Vagococcus elongatus]|uniref:Branched-chain amino acid ABC transporter permease n=1 Tax=Vagococcus elongatus TaxID=180344 RepID=A0A430AZM7_9ENTE|nr:ABC transporter permease [Vagococcus elongatus]RSU13518.1 branched-chain amino acid ABC transporter permease [Vagococcus elongatus]